MKTNNPLTDISLRDQFAMAALTGILSNSAGVLKISEEGKKTIAMNAYKLADLMLKERSKSTVSRYGTKKQ